MGQHLDSWSSIQLRRVVSREISNKFAADGLAGLTWRLVVATWSGDGLGGRCDNARPYEAMMPGTLLGGRRVGSSKLKGMSLLRESYYTTSVL
jgi:hypothetical protein